jgi:2,3-bisphosphoglycerate-dependent phosphoglycerate mutase
VTTILLARHGETDWNRERRLQGSSDTELNEQGRYQARELAAALADVDVTAVYSSDLRRARETAEIVAASKGLAVVVDRDLRERSFGGWEGLTRAEIAERFPDLESHDGETDEEVRRRVLAAVHRIVDVHPGAQVLVVSHGSALNTLWHHASGERLERWDNGVVYQLAFRDGELAPID